MKITDSNISMQSEHSSLTRYSRTESLLAWKLDTGAATTPRPRPEAAPTVTISDAGRAAQAANESDAKSLDPKLAMLISMIEAITGQKVKLFDGSSLGRPGEAASGTPAPQSAAGMRYELHEEYQEIERTSVAASGVIKTADGRTIAFDLDLMMSRSYTRTVDISIRTGAAATPPAQGNRKDPLVINFGGAAAELSDMRFSFDLDGDGDEENLAQFASASGYLALDRNSNGEIDTGKELFGPQTDDGYGELASLDGDRNGWIDENDAVFNELKVWIPGEDGGQLISLREAGVGALALAHVGSRFELRGKDNSDLGAIRDTGVFLFEDGRVGTLQEIDLTV